MQEPEAFSNAQSASPNGSENHIICQRAHKPVPEIAAALVFQQAKEANKRLDDFYNKLIELEEFNKAFKITLTTGEENQDHYKGLIISRLQGLHVQGEEVHNRNSNSRTSSAYSEGERK